MFKETRSRSILKAFSWRALATITTVSLVYIFTGETAMALSIGGIEVFIKMLVYFLHERAWDKIRFGRREVRPFVLWLTGLSGAGKTVVAEELTKRLREQQLKVAHLDGDAVRHLFPTTGFSRAEVNQHIERVGHMASELEKNGVFVVASFLSPYQESRQFVRAVCGNYIEVHVATPIEVCRERDPKGIYAKADRGEIRDLSGVDVPYEAPTEAEIVIDTSRISVSDAATQIMKRLSPTLSASDHSIRTQREATAKLQPQGSGDGDQTYL
jgi:adenylylsulfate kinase